MRRGLDQTVDRMLGCRIARNPRLAELAFNRRRDQDASTLASLDHVLQCLAHAPEHVVQVPIDLEVPLLVAHHEHRSGVEHAARVEHHDVELAEALNGEVDDAFARRLFGRVAGVERGPIGRAYLVECRLALGLVTAVDDDRCALAYERVGDGPADRAGAAGDCRYFSVKFSHVSSSFVAAASVRRRAAVDGDQ